MDHVVQIAMGVPLAFAGWRDLVVRRIPNWVSILLALLGVLLRLVAGPRALGLSIALALMLLAILFLFHARNVIGGGDVKLMVALVLGASPLTGLRFLAATALSGGLLACAYLLLQAAGGGRVPAASCARLPVRLWAVECWRARHSSLPYGLAIVAGAAWVLLPSITV